MRKTYGTKTATRLNLTQCIRLQQNNFLSQDCTTDYDHDEVIARLIELQSRKDSKSTISEVKKISMVSNDDLPPPLPLEVIQKYAEEIDF
jgi:hypothetical protein